MEYADLHIHTYYSDSTLSPEEVAKHAKDRGLAAIAICDHDTINGIDECRAIGSSAGVEVLSGIEMTVEKPDAEIHILGYLMDWTIPWFQQRLKEIQDARVERIIKMIEKLNEHGINVTADDVFAISGKGSVGRMHLAKAMIKKGGVSGYKEVFQKYIGFRKPCYVSNIKFSPREAMQLILKTGGVPVLAHPKLMGNDEHIAELVSCGLRGIEVYHTEHNAAARKHYEDVAKEHNLLMTGGSDCHGMGKGRVLIGEVRVPYELVEKLKIESEKIRREHR